MATSYVHIVGPEGSGLLCSGANPLNVSKFQISGLLGQDTPYYATYDTKTGVASKGAPSWQIDTPCITPHYDGNAWDLRKSEEYNVPLFSHGKFSVGIKPSGVRILKTVDVADLSTDFNGTYTKQGIHNGREYWYYATQGKYLWWRIAGGERWVFSDGLGDTASIDASTQNPAISFGYPWEATDWDPTAPGGVPTFTNYEDGTYALKGDMYACIPNRFGSIDTYHTSGMWGDGIPSTRLTWRFTTPTGGLTHNFGSSQRLNNGELAYLYWGNLALVGGGQAPWGGNTTYSEGAFSGSSTFREPGGRGGGYLGPVGLPPGEAESLIPAKTGFKARENNGLWKNGVKMTHGEETGAMILALIPETVNADCDDAGAGGTPSDQEGHVFSTGGLNGPGGGWVQFSGTLGRRNSSYKNTAVTCNNAWFSLVRLGQTPSHADNISSGDWPNATNPVRLMWGYADTATAAIDQIPYDHDPDLSQKGIANAANPFTDVGPDGWGGQVPPDYRLDFGENGNSGALFLGSRFYGAPATNGWIPNGDTAHACGDPHITPMIGKKYDL